MNEIYELLDLKIETIKTGQAVQVRESILNRRTIWSYGWNPFSELNKLYQAALLSKYSK